LITLIVLAGAESEDDSLGAALSVGAGTSSDAKGVPLTSPMGIATGFRSMVLLAKQDDDQN
jgi:hypothetical protein